MKYIIKICLLFFFISTSIFANIKLIPDILYENIYSDDVDNKYKLKCRKIFPGNFTNSGNDEYIAFYYWKIEQPTEADVEFIYLKIVTNVQ
jgi:hypothetical protein